VELVEEASYRFRILRQGGMRVPGVIFASRALLPEAGGDEAVRQVANVATLPGIVEASYAMPDMHWGYGFPIGGVAATDVRAGGVVSPGGVGFDISCGVRLLAADLDRAEFTRVRDEIMDRLAAATPRGAGPGAVWWLSGRPELERVLLGGSRYAVEQGRGTQRDLDRCEDSGADPGQVSERAVARGFGQLGSLGSGNHFLEVQAVDEIYDAVVAENVRPAPRPGLRDDPLRLSRPRPPDLHRPRAHHGESHAAARNPGPRPPTRLRPGNLGGRPGPPRRHGRRGQLRPGQSPRAGPGRRPGVPRGRRV
jgi:hypothetical protein